MFGTRTLSFVILCIALAGCGGGSTGSKATASKVPTLGTAYPIPSNQRGWGKVKPTEVYNGGDQTGLVGHIVWTSWGGPRAVGHGAGFYEAPDVDVAGSVLAEATIVAFHLGRCDGRRAYTAVEWYFPNKNQSFTPDTYETTCGGFGYYPPLGS